MIEHLDRQTPPSGTSPIARGLQDWGKLGYVSAVNEVAYFLEERLLVNSHPTRAISKDMSQAVWPEDVFGWSEASPVERCFLAASTRTDTLTLAFKNILAKPHGIFNQFHQDGATIRESTDSYNEARSLRG